MEVYSSMEKPPMVIGMGGILVPHVAKRRGSMTGKAVFMSLGEAHTNFARFLVSEGNGVFFESSGSKIVMQNYRTRV
jgi:hypothetical protein